MTDRRHIFGEPKWVGTFSQQLKFECMSLFGLIIEPFRSKGSKGKSYLHVGSGDILIEEFLNVDFYSPKLIVKKALGRISKNLKFRGHDFRRKLPFKDESFEGVFSEHTLEHLDPWHAKRLLSEIKRVLKPGSFLRIVVPNLELYYQFYSGRVPNEAFAKFSGGAEAFWCLTQNWGHQSVWDISNLSKCLEEAGFSEIKQVSFRQGSDTNLNHDLPRRRWESLYVEAKA